MKPFYLGYLISFFVFHYGYKILTVKIKSTEMFMVVYVIEPLVYLLFWTILYVIVKKLFFR